MFDSFLKLWYVAILMFFVIGLFGCMGSLPLKDIPKPGTYKQYMDIRWGKFRRSYLVHVPEGYDGTKPLPVVVAIHGAFSTAKRMERVSGFNSLSDSEEFIAVYPNGIGIYTLLRHWNSGHCCGQALKENIDDVAFLEAVIEDVCDRLNVDRSRIFMAGVSNGGMMTYRFAAERSTLIAAAAVVAGTIGGKPSADGPEWRIPIPKAPVPLIVFHGREDQSVAYEGGLDRIKRAGSRRGAGRTWISVAESVGFWVKFNNCDMEPKAERLRGGRILRQIWGGCKDGSQVVLYSIEGWGHRWPGLYFTEALKEDPIRGFDAAEIIWEFFKGHQR